MRVLLVDRLAVLTATMMAFVLRLHGPGVGLALVYHRVAPRTGDPARELLPAIAVADFGGQLGILRRFYTFTTASQLPRAARERRRGQRIPVAVTFDDDDPGHLAYAVPQLRAHGARATFFLCGGLLDGPRSYWWEDLQRVVDRGGALPAGVAQGGGIHTAAGSIEDMTATERDAVSRDLAAAPAVHDAGIDDDAAGATTPFDRDAYAALASEFEIGFHTREHHPLDTLDDAELARALRDGRSALQEATGQPCDTIAYPNGRTDARTAAAVQAAGFSAGYTTEGHPLTPATEPRLIGRFEPRSRSTGWFALRMALAPLRRP